MLRKILQKISVLQSQGLKSLVVFDLDSTLFDVSPRLQQILHDFALNAQNQQSFPDSTELLKSARTLPADWGIRQAIIRAGLGEHSPEFHTAVKQHWIDSFFSNHYLQYDKPYAGAVDYVRAVVNAGAKVVYLSGRDTKGMEAGTREVLLRWNFPLNEETATLSLKPIKGSDDAEFKKNWFLQIPDSEYAQIWFFENEPLNVNAIREHFTHIEIIFFASTHAGKAEPPIDLPKIYDFEMKE